MNDDAIIAAWLEFHDLDILHASWEGTTLRLAFRFGTVYDQSVSHYGYRTGAVTFYNATVIGSFPTDDDETWLWAGAIQADSKEFAMIPIEEMADTDGGVETRLTCANGDVITIRSQSVAVSLLAVYQAELSASRGSAWLPTNR